jgi:signal transduction histidine kinase
LPARPAGADKLTPMLGRRSLQNYPLHNYPLVIGAALLALLALLATLQYRWIGQVNELESHHMRTSLNLAARHFSSDFDHEVTRAFLYFHPDRSDHPGDWQGKVAQELQRWNAEAPYPRLVRDVLHVHRSAAGALTAEALRPQSGRFEAIPWPADLAALARRLTETAPPPPFGRGSAVAAEIPALVIPLPIGPPPRPGPALHRGGGGGGDGRPGGEIDQLVVRFDLGTVTGEMLPDLTRRYFGSAQGTGDAVAVVDSVQAGRLIFRSDPRLPVAFFRAGDVEAPLLGLRPFDELRNLWAGRRLARNRGGATGPGDGPGLEPPPGGGGGRGHGEAWKLIVKRRNGSLEEAVTRVRRHNLAISAGILLLLALTTGLMMVTTGRAQKLARQQIEFVAAVSHELHTPLTAMRSAGQNLADGVVADPAQVKRYGALIESEGRRLSDMVGQVLDFAGIQSGRQAYTLQPTEVAAVVDGALHDCRWLLKERRARIERDIPAGLPAVQGDAAALRRALRNLIENAAKYGGRPDSPDPWIGVRARSTGQEVEITVEDRGGGLRREDLPYLFEPFYRGREALARSIAGSGLGLSVVRHIAEAHHGRVSVELGDVGQGGQGKAFVLHLPVAPTGPPTAPDASAPASAPEEAA